MPAAFDTGFSVRQKMWHGQGSILAEAPADWDEARLAAGLMWEPTYRDLFVPRTIPAGQPIPAGAVVIEGDVTIKEHEPVEGQVEVARIATTACRVHEIVEGHRAIVRDDTDAVLATPKDSWELIYHHQMGGLLDAYIETWGKTGAQVHFETAGSADGGRKVWAMLVLDEPYSIPGDDSATYPYAALLNSHDGSGACKLLPTEVRVVCQNTWQMASLSGDRTGHQLIIRHTSSAADRLDNARELLAGIRDDASRYREMATELGKLNVDDAMVGLWLEEFIPAPINATERGRNDRAARQAAFLKLYEESPTCATIHGTAYGLLQATGEFLDHLRPFRSQETYLKRTMLHPEPIKASALRRIREIALTGA